MQSGTEILVIGFKKRYLKSVDFYSSKNIFFIVMSDIKDKFGKSVRELRSQKGWSQEEFARKCDLHRTYIGSVERGERNISLENIEKIANTLDVTMDELLKKSQEE